MAKISVTIDIDTEEGTLDVTLNGKKVPSVSSVSCYNYKDMDGDMCPSCSINASEQDEEGGITKVTTYYAMSSEEAKGVDRAKADHSLDGFIGVVSYDPTPDINKFFASKSLFRKTGV